ncbi:transcription-repair coupling factor [Phenylobacterium sp.]|uniref:transcription-repair coupling factor n=1 Tax=Phenylobacterium sp. TaxID=1871053 RepID=UPI0037C90AA1
MGADVGAGPGPADLRRLAEDPGRLDVTGAPEGFDALVMADLIRRRKAPALFIARDSARMSAFVDAFRFFGQGIEVLEIPSWDCLPYDRSGPSGGVSARRMSALARLASGSVQGDTVLIATTIAAASQRLPPREAVAGAGYAARIGNTVDVADLERYFAVNGYHRASTVSEKGEFAIRGGVIDVFPTASSEPVRLDLFGDTLESIRAFDPETQRSTRQLSEVSLLPVSEILLDPAAVSRFRRGYVEAFGAPGGDPLYDTVSGGGRRAGMEHWLPLFYGALETLFDYLPDGLLVGMDALVESALAERFAQVADAFEARDQADRRSQYRPLSPDALYLSPEAFADALAVRSVRRFSGLSGEPGSIAVDMGARSGRSFAAERRQDSVNLFEATVAHARALTVAGKRVLFASWTEGSSERLGLMLADHGLGQAALAPYWDAARANDPRQPQRIVLPLEAGFETPDLAVIAETDILGDRLARPGRRRRASNFLAEASALTPGDLVVHIDHGIGRYEGLRTLDVQGAPHDCLELQYGGEAKLYLPVENIDLLTRYGAEGDGVQLDRLGGAAWQSRKARAKARLRDMAEGLIRIAAERALRSTDALLPPHGVFEEFCARFPFEETEDQLTAIEDVLEDFASGHPMDRLICGDVGFGKTEVALRAAFVAAMSGLQVAVVAPTTLLARQHFKTFSERFQGWPIRVARLSRLTPAREAAEAREGLKKGEIEVVIGTHAVLSKQVGFSHLGLVIVDEEQHFGVKHKEKLKELRADVHMLTLTATPIPRTLQMALSGIREMSIIATPPVDRLAVRTYVTPFDPVALREALLREKFRGGQAYYVVPRISDLTDIERFLREQVPEVRFAVGHGQMPPTQLETVMSAFYDGDYDVLLSTTIVESGLDIPTANTLIIHRSDMFGLSQLYQLRGRVGRSKARAYAYLTTPSERPITLSAERRLKVLQSLDSLGAGFQLASHDLDQRGGGNLLGEEQSGHIREVGVELYQQMLEDEVSELKARGGDAPAPDRGWSPQINTGAAVLIPEAYVPDLNVRLALYRRLSDAEQASDREALAAELIDRFGPLPPEAAQLLKVVGIKGMCREANVAKIDVGPKGAVISFRNEVFGNPAGLVQHIQKNAVTWRLRPDNKVVVKGEWESPAQRLKAADMILKALSDLAA